MLLLLPLPDLRKGRYERQDGAGRPDRLARSCVKMTQPIAPAMRPMKSKRKKRLQPRIVVEFDVSYGLVRLGDWGPKVRLVNQLRLG